MCSPLRPLSLLYSYLCPPRSPRRQSSSDPPTPLRYGRYDSDLTREEDAGYVADGEDCEGEDRPLLRRGSLFWEGYGSGSYAAEDRGGRESVETVVLVGK